MDLDLGEDQQAIRDAVGGFLEKEVTPERVRDAEPGGFDAEVWRGLVDLGVAGMGLAESRGGMDGGLLDLALIAEPIGAHLTPAPFVETATVLRLLERVDAGAALADRFAETLASDASVATLALRPARSGTFRLVPAGAVADLVVGLDGDDLVALDAAPPGVGSVPSNLGAAPVSDRDANAGERTVLESGDAARTAFTAALDDWRVLTAGWLSGLADRALAIGVEYATSREQFGVPIGSFQAVSHRLADVSTEVEGARLLYREAAWAADEGLPRMGVLAGAAYLFASETAQKSAEESLHFHGGYGFTLEYDIQLFFRRAKTVALALDAQTPLLHDLAGRILQGSGRDLIGVGGG